MPRILISLMTLLACPAVVFAHKLPNDEIERRVQIVVKADCVLVEYTLAMNEATVEKQLASFGIEPAEKLEAKWKQYEQIILPTLPKKIAVTFGGETLHLQPLRANYTGWSHRHLVCLLKADISPTDSVTKIVIIDKNFPDIPGHYRIAMKGRSGVKVENTNVPPIVSRAKEATPSKERKERRLALSTAKGDVVLDE
ncbi:MAG: hypothetical protein AAF670_05580 [Planctomycetota bacterium]